MNSFLHSLDWSIFCGVVFFSGMVFFTITDNFKKSMIASISIGFVSAFFGLQVWIISVLVLLTVIGYIFNFIKDRLTTRTVHATYGNRPKSDLEMKDMMATFWENELNHITTEYKGQRTLTSGDHIIAWLEKNNRRIIATLKYICGKSLSKVLTRNDSDPYTRVGSLDPDATICPKLGLLDWWNIFCAPRSISHAKKKYAAFEETFISQAALQFKKRNNSL